MWISKILMFCIDVLHNVFECLSFDINKNIFDLNIKG